jgi:HSP20 family molecular chaperone IbpA
MRLRYRSVTYRYLQGSQQELERHYHQLWHELVRQSQQYSHMNRSNLWRPPADIHETPDAITIKVELAGMRESDLDVTLYPDALVVSGERKDDHEHDEGICYHEAQVRYGPFRIELFIPGEIEREQVRANYEDGFLHVLLPKKVSGPLKPLEKMNQPSEPRTPSGGLLTPSSGENGDSPPPPHYHAPASGPLVVGAKGEAPHA